MAKSLPTDERTLGGLFYELFNEVNELVGCCVAAINRASSRCIVEDEQTQKLLKNQLSQ